MQAKRKSARRQNSLGRRKNQERVFNHSGYSYKVSKEPQLYFFAHRGAVPITAPQKANKLVFAFSRFKRMLTFQAHLTPAAARRTPCLARRNLPRFTVRRNSPHQTLASFYSSADPALALVSDRPPYPHARANAAHLFGLNSH